MVASRATFAFAAFAPNTFYSVDVIQKWQETAPRGCWRRCAVTLAAEHRGSDADPGVTRRVSYNVHMKLTVFTSARWAVGVATLLALASMIRYPGGTARDPLSTGYSLSHNFLSDLGMTVAYDGQPNTLGALLFALSLSILVFALGACLAGFVPLYSEPPGARQLARAAGVVGILVCAAFIGVAATPENRLMGLHVRLTLLAFRIFPIVTALLAIASLYSNAVAVRVAVAWAGLTAVLVGYVVVLGWGPSLNTPDGLPVQVAAQKIVAIAATSIFVYLSIEADRVLPRGISVSQAKSR